MMYTLLVIVGLLSLASAEEHLDGPDYCSADFCQPEYKNVGCNPPPPSGGHACAGKSPVAYEFTQRGVKLILHQHNLLRSRLATGKLASFASASRMPTLVWDEELARQARHNAASCVFGHDACRNTKSFRYVGQNLALVTYSNQYVPLEWMLEARIQHWWNEFNVTTQAQLDRYPKNEPAVPIGHFTQMVTDRSWKMGCAGHTWIEREGERTFYVVCNYSFTNLEGQPVYRRGPAASRCETGENPNYPGLCSVKERIYSTPNAVPN